MFVSGNTIDQVDIIPKDDTPGSVDNNIPHGKFITGRLVQTVCPVGRLKPLDILLGMEML